MTLVDVNTGEKKSIGIDSGLLSVNNKSIDIDFELLSVNNTNVENNNLKQYCKQLREKYKLNNKVLLIQTPQFRFESFNAEVARNRGYYAFPPTGLQCIKKALLGKDLEINLIDLNYLILKKVIEDKSFEINNWLNILDEYLEKNNPSVIGLTSLTSYDDILRSNHPLTAILQHLRKKDKYIIIIGGPTATNEYENYLKDNLCHFVVTKEGESKIRFLFDVLYDILFDEKNRNNSISGIYFKDEEEIKCTNGQKDFMTLYGNLIDTYDSVPIEDYKNIGCLTPYSRMSGQDKIFSVFQLNRGCRANCRFCDVTKFMGRGIRTYSSDILIDEMKYLIEFRGVRHFEVLDDDFLGNKLEVERLLKMMIPLREKYGITWSANNGLLAISITQEIMELIRDSGCNGFRIGIESGNSEMLKRIRKPVTLELLTQKSKILQNFTEIFIGANYIIGLFGEETFGQMLDTFKFAYKMNLDWSSITAFQFTSKETATVENLKSTGGNASDFIPAKDSNTGEIKSQEGVLSGKDVFNIPAYIVPSQEQVKQIWFTFNLIINYICNKNLQPNGNPEKLAKWIEALQVTYPYNPYMDLFAGLCYVLLNDKIRSLKHLEDAKIKISGSEYWQERFNQFDLAYLIDNFPQNKEEVYNSLNLLRSKYSKWLEQTR